MEALNAVLDKVKSNPEVVEKVKGEVKSLAQALHLTKHESIADEKPNDGAVNESTSGGNTEDLGAVQHAVEEIQAVVAAVQQEQTDRDETETEASAEGEKPEREAEKDDPTKRIGFLGFFAMLFERCCSPANKKND